MSDTIDNRVVQLDLESASFERNARKSMKTLDELDKSLEFKNGKRGFEEVERAAEKTNFASLIAAADTVSSRLSALGVIGITALQNITNKAIDTGEKLVKALSVDQVMAGYSKYEQKTASVQTLVNATGKSVDAVNEYLSKLMWFSDETSYGFTDMTQALSTMVTSGGDINKLIPMIMGVANSVAFAGKGATEFSRVMYNLNQSYSAGALKYQDWRSIEMAGAASKELKQAFIDTAVAQKKLRKGQVDIASFSKSLSKGWLDTKVMEKTFGDMAAITQKAYEMVQSGQVKTASQAYEILSTQYDSVAMRAALAAQQAKTLTEAIDSVKDAVSTGWMTTFETIFGDYSKASRLWTTLANDLWDVFASGGEKRNEVLADIFDSGFQKIQKSASEAGVSVDDMGEKMLEVAEGKGVDLGAAINEYGSLDAAIRNVEGGADIAREALTKMSDDNKKTLAQTSEKLNGYKKFTDEYVKGNAWWTKNETAAMRQAAKQGYDWATVQQLMSKTHADLENHYIDSAIELDDYNAMLEMIEPNVVKNREFFDQLGDSTSDLNQKFESFNKRSGTEVIASSLHSLLQTVINIKETVGTAWKNVFGDIDTGSIFEALESFESFAQTLEELTTENEKFQAGLEAVFRILKGVGSVVGSVFGVFGSLARAIGRVVRYVSKLEPVASAIRRIKEIVFGNVSSAPTFLENIVEYIDNLAAAIDSFDPAKFPIIAKAVDVMAAGFKKAMKFGVSFYNAIKPAFPVLLAGLQAVGKFLLKDTFEPFAKFLGDLFTSGDPLKVLQKGLQSAWNWMKNLWTTGRQFIQNVLSKFHINLDTSDSESGLETLTGLFETLRTKIKEVVQNTDFGTLIAGIAGLGVFLSIMRLSEAFGKLGDAAGAVKTTLGNFNKIFKKNLGSTFATNVKTVATAITGLAFAVTLMALVPKDKLWSAVGAVAVLSVVMAALTGALTIASKYISKKDNKSLTTLAKSMAIMAVSILLVAIAGEKLINAFAGIEGFENQWGVMKAALTYLAGIAGVLIGMAFLMNMLKGKIAIGAAVMVLLAVAILAFVKAVGLLDNVDLGASLGMIVTLAVGLAAVAVLFGTIGSKSSGPILKFAAAILAIVAAFGIAVFALQKIMDLAATLKFSGASIGILMSIILGIGVVGLACWGLSKVLEPTIKTAAMIGVAVLALVGAMFLVELLMERIGRLSDINLEDTGNALLKVAIALGIVMAGLAAIAWASDGGKGVFKIAASLLVAIAGVAIMVGIFALLAKITSGMDESQIGRVYMAMVVIAVVLGLLAVAIGYASKLGGGKGMSVVLAALAGMVVMFGIFAMLLVLVKTNDPGPIYGAIVSMIVIAAVIGVLALAIGKAAQLAGEGGSAAAKVFGMVLVVAAIGTSLFFLAKQPWESLLGAALSMAIAILAIASAFAIMEEWNVSVGAVAKLVVGAMLLSAAMGLMVLAVKPLADMDVAKFGLNMLILGGAILILGGAMTALAALGKGAVAVPFMMIAGGLAILGVGILAFAGAAWVFSEAMQNLQGLDFSTLATSLGDLGKASLWTVAAAVAIGVFGLAVGYAAPQIAAFTGAMSGLLGLLGAAGAAWEAGGGSITGFLANLGPEMESSASKTSSAATEMATSLETVTDSVTEAGEEISDAATSSVEGVADAVSGAAPEVAAAATTAVEEAGDAAAEAAPSQIAKIWAAVQGAASGGGLGNIAGMLLGGGAEGMEGLGANIMSSLGSVLNPEQIQGMLSESFGQVDTSSLMSSLFSFKDATPTSIDTSGLTSALQGSIGSAIGEVDTSEAGTQLATTLCESISSGMLDAIVPASIKESGEAVANEAVGGAKEVDASSAGKFFVSGFAKGITEQMFEAVAKARAMAKKAKEAAEKVLGIASPSRVMMKVGRFFVLGFSNAIADNTYASTKNAAYMATAAMTAVDRALAADRYDPITPVLDMSEVYRGIGEFNDVWRPKIRPTLDMSGVNPGVLNARAISSQLEMNAVRSASSAQSFTDSRIVGELGMLREQMANRPIGETSLYINGRKIASAIAGDMNRELSVLAKRG